MHNNIEIYKYLLTNMQYTNIQIQIYKYTNIY